MTKVRKESTGRKRIDPTGEPLVPLNVMVFASLKEWINSFPKNKRSEKVREALVMAKSMAMDKPSKSPLELAKNHCSEYSEPKEIEGELLPPEYLFTEYDLLNFIEALKNETTI